MTAEKQRNGTHNKTLHYLKESAGKRSNEAEATWGWCACGSWPRECQRGKAEWWERNSKFQLHVEVRKKRLRTWTCFCEKLTWRERKNVSILLHVHVKLKLSNGTNCSWQPIRAGQVKCATCGERGALQLHGTPLLSVPVTSRGNSLPTAKLRHSHRLQKHSSLPQKTTSPRGSWNTHRKRKLTAWESGDSETLRDPPEHSFPAVKPGRSIGLGKETTLSLEVRTAGRTRLIRISSFPADSFELRSLAAFRIVQVFLYCGDLWKWFWRLSKQSKMNFHRSPHVKSTDPVVPPNHS